MTKRLRPYQKYDDVKIPTDIETEDFSFPSGHSYGSYFIASKLSQKYPHLTDGLFILADRIAKSRIQAGVHYPSDVEAGKLLALKMSKIDF
jgi:membrane-associated phospholipid phosphatase